jgi:hypothetical protein
MSDYFSSETFKFPSIGEMMHWLEEDRGWSVDNIMGLLKRHRVDNAVAAADCTISYIYHWDYDSYDKDEPYWFNVQVFKNYYTKMEKENV